jgi:putative ABC transport system ATP-binding protein
VSAIPTHETLILEMTALTKTFGSGEALVLALDNLDFRAYCGEVAVVMGPSGAGKTTFLTIAGALMRPTSGSVVVAGTEVTRLSEGRLAEFRRRKVGFIFQSFNLLEALTAAENVQLVMEAGGMPSRYASARAAVLLDMFGMGPRADHLPKELSGGEKQRVAIARALANNPDLVLADEPTANLDSKRGREVMHLLRVIVRDLGKAVVIVTHDLRVREVADRLLWLEDGRFRETPPI